MAIPSINFYKSENFKAMYIIIEKMKIPHSKKIDCLAVNLLANVKSPLCARLKNARIARTGTAFDESAPNFYTNLFLTNINFLYKNFAI